MHTIAALILKAYAWLSLSWPGRLFLRYLKYKLVRLISYLYQKYKNRAENKKESKDQVAKLKDPATDTKEEIDEAIDDALSKL